MTEAIKNRRLWYLTIALMALAIGAVTFFWLSQSSVLAIEDIQVEGNRIISTDEVLETAGPLLRGQSLLSPSFDDASRMISQSPFAESVEVERDFPHTVRIRIREFSPLVNLRTADNHAVVLSPEGRALTQIPAPAPDLPLLTTKQPCAVEVGRNAECPDVIAGTWFLGNIPVNFNQQFAEVTVADGDINAKTRTGVMVHFGSLDDYVLKFEVLRQLLTRTGASGANVSLDVSVPQRPVTKDNTPPPRTTTTPTTPQDENAGVAADETQPADTAADAAADTGTTATDGAATDPAIDATAGETYYPADAGALDATSTATDAATEPLP